jgi:hypothetical protein
MLHAQLSEQRHNRSVTVTVLCPYLLCAYARLGQLEASAPWGPNV